MKRQTLRLRSIRWKEVWVRRTPEKEVAKALGLAHKVMWRSGLRVKTGIVDGEMVTRPK